MTAHANALPRSAKWAFRLSVAIGCLNLLILIFTPLVALFYAGCSFAFARGIRKRRAWAAIAAAAFWLLPIAVAAVRAPILGVDSVVAIALQAGVAFAMLMAARGLWPDPSSRSHPLRWVMPIVFFGVALLCLQPLVTPSASMERTLLIGDHFFLDRATWTLGRTPKRGDIVAFDYPLDRNMIYVKRIAGIPGDRLSLRNRQLYVNGSAVPEPYAIHSQPTVNEYRDNFPRNPDTLVRPRARQMLSTWVHDGELVVPQGSYFVLGDNRDDSDDSRYWGLVERSDIIGSPVLIYTSFDVSTVQLASPNDAITMPTIVHMRWDRMFKLI